MLELLGKFAKRIAPSVKHTVIDKDTENKKLAKETALLIDPMNWPMRFDAYKHYTMQADVGAEVIANHWRAEKMLSQLFEKHEMMYWTF